MRWSLLVVPGLIALTLVVYIQVKDFQFLGFDDSLYVTRNEHVQSGITVENIRWAFAETHIANWHPLTWLSLMLDDQLFGLNPRYFHLTNVVLHLACVLLLYLWLREFTGHDWPSAFVAAIFAVHPLHVESVAWISGRKDLLSTLFGFAALWAYGRFVRGRHWKWYTLSFLALGCSLLSKQMLVTFPFLLLLLDYWPLLRTRWLSKVHESSIAVVPETDTEQDIPTSEQEPSEPEPGQPNPSNPVSLGRLLLEKVPFLLLSVVMSVVIFMAQYQTEAMQGFEQYSLRARLLNVPVAYVLYLKRMVWPNDLAVLYPHPKDNLTMAQAGMALVILAAISMVCCWQIRRRPYLAVGWFWFLGTLVPVIGLIQVGTQQMADRYMYVPMVGLLIAIAWTGRSFCRRRGTPLVGSLAAVAVLAATMAGGVQTRYWEDDVSLFSRTIEVTENNAIAFSNLGAAYSAREKYERALSAYRHALEAEPDNPTANQNFALAARRSRKYDEAEEHLLKAMRLNPNLPGIHANLAGVYFERGETERALEMFALDLEANPDSFETHRDMGMVYSQLGELERAESHFRKAIELQPGNAEPMTFLATLLARSENYEAAIKMAQAAISNLKTPVKLMPQIEMFSKHHALNTQALVYAAQEDWERAEFFLQELVLLNPKLASPHSHLAMIYYRQGRQVDLDREAQQALDLEPRSSLVRAELGWIAAQQGDEFKAAGMFAEAVRLFSSSEADPHNHSMQRLLDFDQSMQQLLVSAQQSAQANPEDATKQFLVGALFAYLEEYEQAQRHLEKAIELDPDLTPAERTLRVVKRRIERAN